MVKEEIKKPNHSVAYCKYCREGFSSENELFQHRKSHERCPFEDCQFNASGKVIAEHVQRVHMKTNSLVKIQDLTTPEQVEKWREERRKRYPTSANVSLRQQAQEARFQRGEKLQDRQQRFGDFQQRNHIKNLDNRNQQKGDWNQKKNQRHQKRDHFDKSDRKQHQKDGKDESPQTSSAPTVSGSQEQETIPTPKPDRRKDFVKPVNTTKPQPALKAFPKASIPSNEDSSDDESRATPRFKGTSQMKNYHQVETIVKEQPALSILGMYGSDSESEVEEKEPAEAPAKPYAASEDIEMKNELVQCSEEGQLDENAIDEAPEEIPIDHITDAMPPASTSLATEKPGRKRNRDNQQSRRQDKKKPRTVLDYSKLRLKPSVNPFLERLLQDDIRHERNVLLQCVNYVVKKRFFDKERADEPVESTQRVTSEPHESV